MTRQKRLNVIITTFADSDMIIGDDIRTVDSQIEIKLIEIDQVIIKKNIKGGWSFEVGFAYLCPNRGTQKNTPNHLIPYNSSFTTYFLEYYLITTW